MSSNKFYENYLLSSLHIFFTLRLDKHTCSCSFVVDSSLKAFYCQYITGRVVQSNFVRILCNETCVKRTQYFADTTVSNSQTFLHSLFFVKGNCIEWTPLKEGTSECPTGVHFIQVSLFFFHVIALSSTCVLSWQKM